MLSGLQDEINLHPELTGACKEIVVNALNEPDDFQGIKISDHFMNHINEFLTNYESNFK